MVREKTSGLPEERAIDTVVLLCGTRETAREIRDLLVEAGVNLETSPEPTQLRIAGRRHNPRQVLAAAATMLTPEQRGSVRVAMVVEGAGTVSFTDAMRSARSLDARLDESRHYWLRELLTRDGLVHMGQPIIDPYGERLEGYEMLVRGDGIDGDSLTPGQLFEAAAALDLTTLLDQRCRTGAILRAAELLTGEPDALAFINFEVESILHPSGSLQATTQAIARTTLSRKRVVFESSSPLPSVATPPDLTPGGRPRRDAHVKHLMTVLSFYREQGFAIAVNDVSEGDLLELFRPLKPLYVKLAPSLTASASDGVPEAVEQLARIVRIAGEMSAKVVAVGTRSRADAVALGTIGVHLVQGAWPAAPMLKPPGSRELGQLLAGRSPKVA